MWRQTSMIECKLDICLKIFYLWSCTTFTKNVLWLWKIVNLKLSKYYTLLFSGEFWANRDKISQIKINQVLQIITLFILSQSWKPGQTNGFLFHGFKQYSNPACKAVSPFTHPDRWHILKLKVLHLLENSEA